MTCCICGKSTATGVSVSTNGDPYADGKKAGIDPGPFKTYCCECHNQAPDLNQAISEAFRAAGMCGFIEAWAGRCTNQQPCPKHSGQKCWKCGGQATENCGHAGMFVCGMPQCHLHPHKH